MTLSSIEHGLIYIILDEYHIMSIFVFWKIKDGVDDIYIYIYGYSFLYNKYIHDIAINTTRIRNNKEDM